jgi:hypothetical protein
MIFNDGLVRVGGAWNSSNGRGKSSKNQQHRKYLLWKLCENQRKMSVTSKVVFGLCCTVTVSTIAYVHIKQDLDR